VQLIFPKAQDMGLHVQKLRRLRNRIAGFTHILTPSILRLSLRNIIAGHGKIARKCVRQNLPEYHWQT